MAAQNAFMLKPVSYAFFLAGIQINARENGSLLNWTALFLSFRSINPMRFETLTYGLVSVKRVPGRSATLSLHVFFCLNVAFASGRLGFGFGSAEVGGGHAVRRLMKASG